MNNAKNNFLVYGANGYTGELIVRYAVERGMRPILAGRNAAAIGAIAKEHNLEHRVFSLEETAKLDAALDDVAMVLHCAGPFSLTSRQMVEACLRKGVHYTDITGEISVFESMAALDQRAKDAGIMLMPGVGFDVVPSDCLALHLKNQLPSATHLSLAFYSKGGMSHGTQATMIMNIGRGGAIREAGKIKPVPAAWKSREVDFGETRKQAMTIPWGDVSTAFYSTGIPNIEVYSVVPDRALMIMQLSSWFGVGWMLSTRPLQKFLQGQIPPGGPTDDQRQEGQSAALGRGVRCERRPRSSPAAVPRGLHHNRSHRPEYHRKDRGGKFDARISNAGESVWCGPHSRDRGHDKNVSIFRYKYKESPRCRRCFISRPYLDT